MPNALGPIATAERLNSGTAMRYAESAERCNEPSVPSPSNATVLNEVRRLGQDEQTV